MPLFNILSEALKIVSSFEVQFPIGKTPKIRFRPKTPKLSLNDLDRKIKSWFRKENPHRTDLVLALRDLGYKNEADDIAEKTLEENPEDSDLASLIKKALKYKRKI